MAQPNLRWADVPVLKGVNNDGTASGNLFSRNTDMPVVGIGNIYRFVTGGSDQCVRRGNPSSGVLCRGDGRQGTGKKQERPMVFGRSCRCFVSDDGKSAGKEFVLLGVFLGYEVISMIRPSFFWYCVPFVIACLPTGIGLDVQLMLTLLMCMLYIQHDFVVASYQEQTKEDILSEQRLKRDMHEQEYALREEIDRSLLKTENQLLEERARLSQLLHDKLGHNINGSVYQLEAVKLIMEQEPETAKSMIQAVIDQQRTGMNEIRAILRRERPQKYKLALLQLQQLCDECNQKGVEAQLHIEGELSEVPEKYLEIILDNAFEAVSNALKYAKCTRIEMEIHVLNQMIRCRISDNGVGCAAMEDGMGIAGMRRRVREVNGILDFETEIGFTINILLPR